MNQNRRNALKLSLNPIRTDRLSGQTMRSWTDRQTDRTDGRTTLKSFYSIIKWLNPCPLSQARSTAKHAMVGCLARKDMDMAEELEH